MTRKLPPFCENCGQDIASMKASITLKADTVAKAEAAGFICQSSHRKAPHFSLAGLEALYRRAGIERPDPWALLEALAAAGGKLRTPARVLGPRQHKAALKDFHAFYLAFGKAIEALGARK